MRASHKINLNGGSIQDSSSQELVNAIPQEYHNFPDVKVDTIHRDHLKCYRSQQRDSFWPQCHRGFSGHF